MAESGSGGRSEETTLSMNRFYDENWYLHLMYSVHRAERISDLHAGDVIVLHRGMYLHFAIVIQTDAQTDDVLTIDLHGDDMFGEGDIGKRTFNIREEEVWILDIPEEDSHPPDEVISRAFSRIGTEKYNLVSNNCEHFAMWCKTGDRKSKQVLVAGLASVAVVGGLLLGATSIFKTLVKNRRREDDDYV